MNNHNLFNEAKELQNEGHSMRAIGETLGISKSQVQRILKKGQPSQAEKDTIIEPSQSVPKLSQSVPEPLQNENNTDRDTENNVIVEKKPKKNGIREIKKKEYLLKGYLNTELQNLIDQEDFTLEELTEVIDFFEEGKSHADRLYTERLDFDENAVDNASFFLNELIRFLKQPQSKMKSLRPNELLKERKFKFVESSRIIEYEEDDEEHEYEDEYEDVIAVKLFSRYDSMKSRIEEFLEVKQLNDIEI